MIILFRQFVFITVEDYPYSSVKNVNSVTRQALFQLNCSIDLDGYIGISEGDIRICRKSSERKDILSLGIDPESSSFEFKTCRSVKCSYA